VLLAIAAGGWWLYRQRAATASKAAALSPEDAAAHRAVKEAGYARLAAERRDPAKALRHAEAAAAAARIAGASRVRQVAGVWASVRSTLRRLQRSGDSEVASRAHEMLARTQPRGERGGAEMGRGRAPARP
jgi:hypothetical protein